MVETPNNITANEIISYMLKSYNILISGSFGYLSNKVIRIGHMGENANTEKLIYILNSLDSTLKHLGFKSENCLVELFNKYY
ncbi:hypothetical protein M918_24515 [Clostridium sp. BL8]|nr:hypothetical protein M918_24515 [Clostridium sp. BL8]